MPHAAEQYPGDPLACAVLVTAVHSMQEDARLVRLVEVYGIHSWPEVAAGLHGRDSKSCSLRWGRSRGVAAGNVFVVVLGGKSDSSSACRCALDISITHIPSSCLRFAVNHPLVQSSIPASKHTTTSPAAIECQALLNHSQLIPKSKATASNAQLSKKREPQAPGDCASSTTHSVAGVALPLCWSVCESFQVIHVLYVCAGGATSWLPTSSAPLTRSSLIGRWLYCSG